MILSGRSSYDNLSFQWARVKLNTKFYQFYKSKLVSNFCTVYASLRDTGKKIRVVDKSSGKTLFLSCNTKKIPMHIIYDKDNDEFPVGRHFGTT